MARCSTRCKTNPNPNPNLSPSLSPGPDLNPTPYQVLDALQEFLSPYRTTLDALFRHCCLTGRGAGQFEAEAMNSMGPSQAGHHTHVQA